MATHENNTLAHIINKSLSAQKADSVLTLSTGEALAAAMVLNRPDWLAVMGYTLAETIERIGPEWLQHIPTAAEKIQARNSREECREAERLRNMKLAMLEKQMKDAEEIDVNSELITYGYGSGREVSLTFDLVPFGAGQKQTIRMTIHVSPKDGKDISQHIYEVHKRAWRDGCRPFDSEPDERRPLWIDAR